MNLASWIILAVVVVIVAFAIKATFFKSKKSKGGCCCHGDGDDAPVHKRGENGDAWGAGAGVVAATSTGTSTGTSTHPDSSSPNTLAASMALWDTAGCSGSCSACPSASGCSAVSKNAVMPIVKPVPLDEHKN